MLVLSRRPEESIAIGSNITVVVLGIKGNQVRLGFRAPRDVVIDRTDAGPALGERTLTMVTLQPTE